MRSLLALVLCPLNLCLLAPPSLPGPPARAPPLVYRAHHRHCSRVWSAVSRVRGGGADDAPRASSSSGGSADGGSSVPLGAAAANQDDASAETDRRIQQLLARTAELDAEKAAALAELRRLRAANFGPDAPPHAPLHRVHACRDPSWWHPAQVQVCICMCMCMCACVCACVCVHVCGRACVHVSRLEGIVAYACLRGTSMRCR